MWVYGIRYIAFDLSYSAIANINKTTPSKTPP